MSKCPYCNKTVTDNQVLCMNCGSQIKPLKAKRKLFGGRINVILSVERSNTFEMNVIEDRVKETKRRLKTPRDNLILDQWL
ncbi:MAG: zinc-ribbon domain-containing protein [Promethearchaeota archaeon]|nr:MAG: zinc-ribbon domain-containing protein [Candidatus Lokiarchaeota archaeon]